MFNNKQCLLLVLLIIGTVQVVKSFLGLFLDLVQIHQGGSLVVLKLGRSISLQGTGLGT